MLTLTGYANRLSVIAGDTIQFHVAKASAEVLTAEVVRVDCADPNPAIGGIRYTSTALDVHELGPACAQHVPIGSYASLGSAGLLENHERFTLCLLLQPRLRSANTQVICSNRDESAQGFQLEQLSNGQLALRMSSTGQDHLLSLEAPLHLGSWYRVLLSVDGPAQRAALIATDLRSSYKQERELCTNTRLRLGSKAQLSLASASAHKPLDCFNGRIEDPWLLARILDGEQTRELADAAADPDCIAAWDFSQAMHSQRVVDIGPFKDHGELFNTPTRAVRGSQWNGKEQCFRHAPRHYAAIHFHQDDLDDCRWPATHAVQIPLDFASDAYALLLKTGTFSENIPFFVVPPKGQARSKIAVLVSTYTYTVYGNHARPEWFADPAWRESYIDQVQSWGAYPHNPGEHQDFGLSTYNSHPDGSGIGLVSWRRPMLNLRMGYLTYPYPEIRASGLRHYPADSHLLMWLKHHKLDFDLVTDEELHREGLDRLRPYQTLITGSHPEYHSEAMLDALQNYRDQGGKLIYLGGNGFYWKIALDPAREGIIEVRRAEGGIRAWAAEPGEYFHQFDSEYGGLWRRNARPPQQLVGVGFTAQGNFVGSYYRIRKEARADPLVSWILEGIDEEIIGLEGFSGHGAAGFELDRADERLGTPARAVVIASSEKHPADAPWVLVPEEQLTHITTLPGKSHQELIRADMTYFDCPGGGAVGALVSAGGVWPGST
ncbi:MAG: N,N-dimethylformamidase large subunit [Betaproteobacteria bacterium]|nr:N,N-dimethylformamidase large subunit [Betaproteobacteria bacterium]